MSRQDKTRQVNTHKQAQTNSHKPTENVAGDWFHGGGLTHAETDIGREDEEVKARQVGKTRADQTRQNKVRHGKTRRDDKSRQNNTRQDKARQDKARQINTQTSTDKQ